MFLKGIETPWSYFGEILEKVSWKDILKVLGVKIKKQKSNGGVLIILCPFHDEKTPSLRMNEDKGVFMCLGCGQYGNQFSFVQKFLNPYGNYSKIRTYHWFKKNFDISLPWEKSNGHYIFS